MPYHSISRISGQSTSTPKANMSSSRSWTRIERRLPIMCEKQFQKAQNQAIPFVLSQKTSWSLWEESRIAQLIDVCVSNRHLVPYAIRSGHATTGKPRRAGATAPARDGAAEGG